MSNNILIVDGCAEYRTHLVDFFTERDFQADGCGSYREAQKILSAKNIDIAIVDCFIGNATIEALASALNAGKENETAIIIMNARQTPDMERKIRLLNPDFYLVKPFTVDNLYAVVLKITEFRQKKLLQNRKQRSAA